MKKVLITALLGGFLLTSAAFAVKAEVQTGNAKTRAQAVQTAGESIRARIEEMKQAREEEKAQLKTQILAKVKERAENAIDRAVTKYERVQERIEKMPNISDEAKEAAIAKIETQIEKVKALKSEVEAAETVEQVKVVMTKLKTEYKFSLTGVKEAVKAIHASHLGNIIEKLGGILTKLEAKIENMTEGAEKTEALSLQTQASASLATAKTKAAANNFEGAKADIQAAKKALVQLAQTIKVQTQTEGGEE